MWRRQLSLSAPLIYRIPSICVRRRLLTALTSNQDAGRRICMSLKPPPEENQRPWLEEHDACALIGNIRKGGRPTHGNVKRTLAALGRMGHRTGEVAGEGDGCGLLTD